MSGGIRTGEKITEIFVRETSETFPEKALESSAGCELYSYICNSVQSRLLILFYRVTQFHDENNIVMVMRQGLWDIRSIGTQFGIPNHSELVSPSVIRGSFLHWQLHGLWSSSKVDNSNVFCKLWIYAHWGGQSLTFDDCNRIMHVKAVEIPLKVNYISRP